MLFWHLGMTVLIVFVTLGRRRIDFRMVMLGAILPDVLDKPIGRIFFADSLQNSRLAGHALITWVVVLLFIQITLRGERARQWFILPIAAMLHLGLDAMWNQPLTFLWPLFGWDFPEHAVANYWWLVLTRLLDDPWLAVQEVIGLSVLLYFAWAFELYRRQPMRRFLRRGAVGGRVAQASVKRDN